MATSKRLNPSLVRPFNARFRYSPRGGYLYQPVRRTARLFLVCLLIILLGGLFYPAFAGPPGPGAGPPPSVTVAPVKMADVNPSAEYVGHVEALEFVELRARVEGFLEQVRFHEGDFVHKGDLLYVIEQAPFQAKRDAARARVTQAEAGLDRARRYLDRAKAVGAGGVSATDLDNAVADELGARGRLEEARANLQLAEINLGYTKITAPISGRIGKTRYTEGNLVNPASGPLARINQLDPIRVVYSVSENDMPAILAAMADAGRNKDTPPLLMPRIRLANGETIDAAGRIDFVDNQVDPSTGTIAVYALFDNPKAMLLPGRYVTALVRKTSPRLMPVVPQACVMEDQNGRYVLVVDDKSRVVMRRITTGPLVGTDWAVESGVGKGERVIVEGVQKVRPGMTVKTAAAGNMQGR